MYPSGTICSGKKGVKLIRGKLELIRVSYNTAALFGVRILNFPINTLHYDNLYMLRLLSIYWMLYTQERYKKEI